MIRRRIKNLKTGDIIYFKVIRPEWLQRGEIACGEFISAEYPKYEKWMTKNRRYILVKYQVVEQLDSYRAGPINESPRLGQKIIKCLKTVTILEDGELDLMLLQQ